MRVSIDHEHCCGAGMCVLIAPDVFDQHGADGQVVRWTLAAGGPARRCAAGELLLVR